MDDIFEQIRSGKIWDFPGGIHPPERKDISNATPAQRLPLASELILPLKQHIGSEGHLLVAAGEKVLKGQQLTGSADPMSVPIHAPTSGRIKAIEEHAVAHPSGLKEMCILLEPDGEESWCQLTPIESPFNADKEFLLETLCHAGVVGLGGAGFPTDTKLRSCQQGPDFLLLNGSECEPYITCDDRLMREYADEIMQGILLLQYILNPRQIIVGIEDDKPEAIAAMELAASEHSRDQDEILVRAIPTKYPSGGEKQLIQILTGREVPSGGLPVDVGTIMQNVGTAFAVKRALMDGEPLLERLVTVTGEDAEHPGNYWVPFGTPVSHLIEQVGINPEGRRRVIMGGPMMGFILPDTNIPVVKISNCIIMPALEELPPEPHEIPCIRCGQCSDACPAALLPQQLQWFAKSQEYDKLESHNLFDCIECGACAYVCPSDIPLVQLYRAAKAEIRHQREDKLKAEQARARFEAKKARLAREKHEREERHKRAAEARRKKMAERDADGAVAAAMARVKARKQQPAPTIKASQSETGELVPDNREVIAERQRRKLVAREARQQAVEMTPADAEITVSTPKDDVAAAIARVKAKKAKQHSEQAQADTQAPAEGDPSQSTENATQDKNRNA